MGLTLKEYLKGKIPDEYISLVKRSYDIIGDIAVLEIPKELEKYEKIIAEGILKIHKNVKVVCKKAGKVEGEFRVRKVEVILGEKRTWTIHKENGLKFKLDISKVFYTPRLANDRLRVAKQVKEGELVADLFAGVGPYAILIAKLQPKCKVIAIDKNPFAYKFLVENIKLNKVNNIEAYCGDCREVVKELNLYGKVDRVIMHRPKIDDNFYDMAFLVPKKGGVVHYYTFLHEKEFPDKGIKDLKKAAKEFNKEIEIINAVRLNEIAPRLFRAVIEFKLL